MSELNKQKIATVGMCFREHGQPYLTSHQNYLIKQGDLIGIKSNMCSQNEKIKEGLKNIIMLKKKIDIANQKAENDIIRRNVI
jgi:hypothetical protein